MLSFGCDWNLEFKWCYEWGAMASIQTGTHPGVLNSSGNSTLYKNCKLFFSDWIKYIISNGAQYTFVVRVNAACIVSSWIWEWMVLDGMGLWKPDETLVRRHQVKFILMSQSHCILFSHKISCYFSTLKRKTCVRHWFETLILFLDLCGKYVFCFPV